MEIQGNYILPRVAYEKSYDITISGTINRHKNNTFTVGAVFAPDLRDRHDVHLFTHGVQNITAQIFKTIDSTVIRPLDIIHDGAWGSDVRVEGEVILTKEEYQQLVQYEKQYAEALKAYQASKAELQELSESISFADVQDKKHQLFEIEDMMVAYKYQIDTTQRIQPNDHA